MRAQARSVARALAWGGGQGVPPQVLVVAGALPHSAVGRATKHQVCCLLCCREQGCSRCGVYYAAEHLAARVLLFALLPRAAGCSRGAVGFFCRAPGGG